jgi:hypothetical protein
MEQAVTGLVDNLVSNLDEVGASEPEVHHNRHVHHSEWRIFDPICAHVSGFKLLQIGFGQCLQFIEEELLRKTDGVRFSGTTDGCGTGGDRNLRGGAEWGR